MTVGERGVLHVLLVHFNTPELTGQALRGIPRTTAGGRPVRIHVLDNCSSEENVLKLRQHVDGLDGVVLQLSQENLGFGEGINFLSQSDGIAESDILWILNPDTRVEDDCVDRLESELDSKNYSIVSPLIFSGEGLDSWIWYCGGTIDLRGMRVQHALYGSSLAAVPERSFETEFITGAAPMMQASTFRAVGGFPAGYFLYWEDTYFCWKARRLGLRLGVVPAARIWHAVGASSGTGLSQTYYYWSTCNRFTFAQDVGVPRWRLVFGRGGFESLRPIAKSLLERDQRLGKAKAAVRGTLRGFRSARRKPR